jgi:hypothetical protein
MNLREMRTGLGTIKGFKGNSEGVIVGIQRFGSEDVRLLPCDPEVAARMLKSFGVRTSERFTDMEGVIGLPCRWTESNMGAWSNIEALAN